MKIVEIQFDNKALFAASIDPDIAENIERKAVRALAAIADETVLGTLVWESRNYGEEGNSAADICWFDADEPDAAAALMDAFIEETEAEEVDLCRFELADPSENVLAALAEAGFSCSRREGMDIELTLEEISQLSFVKKVHAPYVRGLEELSPQDFRQGIIQCLFHGRRGLMQDVASVPMEWYEPQISSCVLTDGRVSGFLLIHAAPSGLLIPTLLYASGPDLRMDMVEMIRYSVQMGGQCYAADTRVLIRRHDKTVRALTDKLFPDRTGIEVTAGELDTD